jgi:alkylhydroperoxidase/carboxymuconolactone decarboxylase family protein YurZ
MSPTTFQRPSGCFLQTVTYVPFSIVVLPSYDYGFVGEMSVLMNAHPLIGPALGELFMQVMFAPGALTRPEREMVAAVAAAAQDCEYRT